MTTPSAATHQPAPTGHVLVIDDEPMVRDVVIRYLERHGHRVTVSEDGATGLALFERDRFDCVVLDLMLPSMDGLTVLRRIRDGSTTPVILLTARGEEADRVLGLELGADDYVVKPFSPRELTARVGSVLRRVAAPAHPETRQFDGLHIDEASREVHRDGRLVQLTRREFDLLTFLARSPRQVFTRSQLLEHVWDSSPEWQDPTTVTVHVGHLRQKIEDDPATPRRIVTVRGVGYRFEP